MENLQEDRIRFESLGSSYPVNDEVRVEKDIQGGVEIYRFIPKDVVSPEIVIFLHGGGFMYGSIRSHRAMVSHIAAATGRTILYVEYSLAPEKPFPHALNESTAVIEELLRTLPSVQFAIMGDSAGGNLAMSTVLNLKKLNRPLPLYHVLICPWLNLQTEYPSYAENEKLDPIITKEFVEYAASEYTDRKHYTDPFVSPVLGSYKGFNPTLTMVGKNEVLRDDSLQLHQILLNSGCMSTLRVFDDVTHVWTLTNITSAESKEALSLMRGFMDAVSIAKMSVNAES